MIDYINKLLNDWARWKASDGATVRHMLGVKNCWPQMLKDDDPDHKYEKHGTLVPLNDLECCLTDKAVCALPDDLQAAVIEYYTRVGTAESTARRLGVSKVTLFARIGRAHWHMLGTLNELAAGAGPHRPVVQPASEPTLPLKIACVHLN